MHESVYAELMKVNAGIQLLLILSFKFKKASFSYFIRVFSAYVKDVEAKPSGNVWGSKLPLGACLMEFGGSGMLMIIHNFDF